MVVIEHRRLLGLDPREEITETLVRIQPDPDRDGVDEQADGRLDAREVRRPAGDGRAEDDVVATGQEPQHDSPRGLHDGAEGDPPVLGANAQPSGQVGIEPEG